MIVILSDAAMADLEAIGDWIARDNPARAISFTEELLDAAQALAEMPLRFPLVPGKRRRPIRHRNVKDYLICYTVSATRVEVVRILHGARAYQTLLDVAPKAD